MILFSIILHRFLSFRHWNWICFLIFVHVSTAVLTGDHAVFDREEIIQLSMDSIHIVTSTESQIPSTSEVDDDEYEEDENDLLMTLLTSFERKSELPREQPPHDSISLLTNSSSIRLIPSFIHFPDQSIAIPHMQTVILANDHSEPLEILTCSGLTNEFYAAVSKQSLVEPHGGNVTINVYYFPLNIGPQKSAITIQTNRGDFSYDVSGIGIPNPYHLRPLLNIEIPLNSTFEYPITFHNPSNHSLSIVEVYTSDENFLVQLIIDEKTQSTTSPSLYERWYFRPYETKPIAKIHYFAQQVSQVNAFIGIRTHLNETIILPVQINVSTRAGLYSNVDLLELNADRSFSSKQIPIYAFNYGIDPVTITGVCVNSEYRQYLSVRYRNLAIPSDVNRLNQIGDVIVYWNLIPYDVERIYGRFEIYTSMNEEEPMLEIPFDEEVIHGTLDYRKEETYFLISNEKPSNECRSIRFFSHYDIPIAIYKITIDKLKLLMKYIEIRYPTSLIYLHPNQWSELLCITLLPQASTLDLFESIQMDLDIETNLLDFTLPVHFYTGLLELDLFDDETNGGIQQNEYKPLELIFTSIPINTTRSIRFILRNSNPLDITIKQFDVLISNAQIQVDYIKSLDDDQTTVNIEDQTLLFPIVIPQQHEAVFLLTMHAIEPPGFYNESISIETNYQTIDINVKYQITNGSIELVNETPMQIDVFPNHLSSTNLYLHNRFAEPINITRIHFSKYGFCFSFTWSNTTSDGILIEANQTKTIGSIYFDVAPLCKSILPPSESTCYCGLNYHPEFQRQWDESSLLVNNYELDHKLIQKFRNLWEQWTSLVQKHKIQTNIWLSTSRANISWPVTINFVWPSVLTQKSSAATIDFQMTFINTTKIQNVTITNPSSDLVTYSVILLSNSSTPNEHIFTISTISKPVASIDNLYNFHLLPNEQIIFTVAYRPTSSIKDQTYLVVRNNLTIVESILLRGEGGIGGLKVGSSQIPLLLEIDTNQQYLCSTTDENPPVQQSITLQNTGNMKTIITEIFFGHSRCVGHGFSAPICTDIVVQPHETYELQILFRPNYTSDEIHEILTLNTNIGLMIYPLLVRIPSRVLLACDRTIARPTWEWRTYCLYSCFVICCIVLIRSAAPYNTHLWFFDYVRRTVWRYRIQIMNNMIFDLRDLSSTVQNGEKIDKSSDTTAANDGKKETKQKRAHNTSATRTTSTVNFKENLQKTRRATMDHGVAKPPTKPTSDNSTKSLPSLRRLKSDQQPPLNPTSTSNPSDEETEAAFAFARTKHLSNKRKGSITTTSSIVTKPSSHFNPQDLIQLDDSGSDQQWHMVSSNKGHRRGTVSRRETTDESQKLDKTTKTTSTDPVNPLTLMSTSRAHSLISQKATQPRHHDVPPTHTAFPVSVPIPNKRKSFQDNSSLITANRELAFRQLTEQLWAEGESPPSTTAYSISARSRRSSAPASERGVEDDTTKSIGTEIIDWDDADLPDSDFGRYASQTEHSMDDVIETNDQLETQQKSSGSIPPLMSLTITPPTMTTTVQSTSPLSTSVIKENIEPLPYPQHVPGPIQRPNKFSSGLLLQASSVFRDPTHSPDTPDVLLHINHLVDRQNSIAAAMPNNDANVNNPSSMINDVTTPNVPWTPFSPPDWSAKYESSWPMPVPTQNPFAQRQVSTDDPNLWTESSLNISWLKFPTAPAANRQESEPTNAFWNLSEASPNSPSSWWPKMPSDENNNDQSRWEFAR